MIKNLASAFQDVKTRLLIAYVFSVRAWIELSGLCWADNTNSIAKRVNTAFMNYIFLFTTAASVDENLSLDSVSFILEYFEDKKRIQLQLNLNPGFCMRSN